MNNEPAFPISNHPIHESTLGISIRDYFAAKAMQGMICADTDNGRFRDDLGRTAEIAYRMADAMLKARKLDVNKV